MMRPRDHFTPGRGWMNDPNGLIHHDGQWHLYFQHEPDALVHGRISWGHAVSRDLVSWTELPTAIEATPETHIWSGSVVHDVANTSGFGSGGSGPLVALWTGFDPVDRHQVQCLSFSLDSGHTWTAHPANPVLDVGSTAFRDPKVFRHGERWLMVLVLADERTVEIYQSNNLTEWTHTGSFGPEGHVDGVWECPDLIVVPVEGTDESAAVLLVSVEKGAPAGGTGVQYFVGVLAGVDGVTFSSIQEARWVDHGADFYAAVSYSEAPGSTPVVQGWMSNWQYAIDVPATDYRGAMTLARRLTLRRRGNDLVLVQRPVTRQGAVLYGQSDRHVSHVVTLPVRAASFRMILEVARGSADRFGLNVRVGDDERTTVWVDWTDGTVALDRRQSGTTDFHPSFAAMHVAPLPPGVARLEVVVDVSSVEVFAGDGEVAITDLVFPDDNSTGIEMFADGGAAHVRTLSIW